MLCKGGDRIFTAEDAENRRGNMSREMACIRGNTMLAENAFGIDK